MRDRKSRREVKIFKKFITVSSYATRIRSIRKKKPPHPDILCTLHTGSKLAFELVEIIDQEFARRTFSGLDASKKFYAEYQALSPDKRKKINHSLRNALIYVAFKPDVTQKQRHRTIPALFDYLISLPPNVEGQLKFKPHESLFKTVRWIHIGRGSFRGPQFNVEAVGTLGNPVVPSISGKLRKRYPTRAPLELLAYYELQPEMPGNPWVPEVRRLLRDKFAGSQFTRVWIFSVASASIVFVHP